MSRTHSCDHDFKTEASYGNTTGNAFGSYMLYELGNGAGHSSWRRGSGDGDSTDVHSHGCSADERSVAVQPDFNSNANPATNHHRSTDADHHQGSRRKYAEHASVTQRSQFNVTNAWNSGEQSADESIHADGSVSPFGRNVDIRREWESSQRESEFDDSGLRQSRFNQPDRFRFNDPNGSESSE